jgi:alpha-tubulin suppressor-like RCC1 family protein
MTSNFKTCGTDLDDVFAPRSWLALCDDRLFSWGDGSSGKLGLGDSISRSSPVQVSFHSNWSSVSAGFSNSLAIKTNGTLWSWGCGNYGSLGVGDSISRSSPVQVGSSTDWSSVSAGGASHAIKTDGTLWSWGTNNSGQLGLGNRINRSSPVQVGSLTNWASVSAGASHSLATKTDGTLWSWGCNNCGQLGLNQAAAFSFLRSSPTQVGSLTNWNIVCAGSLNSIAIKTDGTLWGWGGNFLFSLTNSVQTAASSPVQLGSDNNWASISLAKTVFCTHTLATKTDGTLWSWGHGAQGALGKGSTFNSSTPGQVGSLTNWASVSAACTSSRATKTDGTLWVWGSNSYHGVLGLGNPVRVILITGSSRIARQLGISLCR